MHDIQSFSQQAENARIALVMGVLAITAFWRRIVFIMIRVIIVLVMVAALVGAVVIAGFIHG